MLKKEQIVTWTLLGSCKLDKFSFIKLLINRFIAEFFLYHINYILSKDCNEVLTLQMIKLTLFNIHDCQFCQIQEATYFTILFYSSSQLHFTLSEFFICSLLYIIQ